MENNHIEQPIGKVTATDLDEKDNALINYDLDLNAKSKFRIDYDGRIYSIFPLDRENQEVYNFSVIAIDNAKTGPKLISSAFVCIKVRTCFKFCWSYENFL